MHKRSRPLIKVFNLMQQQEHVSHTTNSTVTPLRWRVGVKEGVTHKAVHGLHTAVVGGMKKMTRLCYSDVC